MPKYTVQMLKRAKIFNANFKWDAYKKAYDIVDRYDLRAEKQNGALWIKYDIFGMPDNAPIGDVDFATVEAVGEHVVSLMYDAREFQGGRVTRSKRQVEAEKMLDQATNLGDKIHEFCKKYYSDLPQHMKPNLSDAGTGALDAKRGLKCFLEKECH